ncbi:uncharacterized protein LOC110457112 [Mizuhopecten yessoensis]|uniref:Uncharacterized protein n=1 Tax=Mizuhopecten yessoensis TaxID=6573 RepID=A0A210Q9H7_MIZYE|nr:uncharacterized protein LOC110457112 [Mizuhopecten yessoensis]XP_021363890.1 uncharacterized protein LOC110457112 [Mizuhopecten yessoensis]OWF45393.1 hypothetical protein KP79_PYT19327 [Mizuhopecten yessoensis]
MNHLRKDCEGFKKMLSQLQSDVDTDYNVRFIINTELEDKLTNTDIVRIEVIDSCHSDASAVTFEQEGWFDQQASGSSLIGQHAQEEPSPPPADDEPLPAYGNVVRQSFIQRRRPFKTSIVKRKGSASNPPVPIYNDPLTPSASPRPSYHNPHSPNYPTNFNQQAYPTLYKVPPLQPSAPPVSMAAFSHLPDFHYPRRPCSMAPIPRDATTITMLKFKSEMDTKIMGDNHVPSLVGIAMLGEFFVVVDQTHCCVRRVMYDSMNIVAQYLFDKMVPWNVAGVTETLCVVTCPNEGKLVFVNFSNTPSGPPATLQRTMKSGKYLSIGCCKTSERLICGRGPPFSAARIDILNMQGQVIEYINLKKSFMVPRCLAITESKFLAFCDIHNHEAMVYDIENTRNAPEVLRGHKFHSLKEPQGIAILPQLKSLLILDASCGDVYITSHSGDMRKCLSGDISLERQGNTEIKYSISISMDQKILAVAHKNGTVKFYEIKYM